MQRAAGDEGGDLGIAQPARDDTIGADGVDAGADYFNEMLLERGDGSRQ
jgi:hypothetical protein